MGTLPDEYRGCFSYKGCYFFPFIFNKIKFRRSRFGARTWTRSSLDRLVLNSSDHFLLNLLLRLCLVCYLDSTWGSILSNYFYVNYINFGCYNSEVPNMQFESRGGCEGNVCTRGLMGGGRGVSRTSA